jgi:hypothetical protein
LLPKGVVEHRSPTGTTVWMNLPDCTPDFGILWPGSGAGLFIGQPTTPRGSVIRIEHRTADGEYATLRKARAAVAAFLAAGMK